MYRKAEFQEPSRCRSREDQESAGVWAGLRRRSLGWHDEIGKERRHEAHAREEGVAVY